MLGAFRKQIVNSDRVLVVTARAAAAVVVIAEIVRSAAARKLRETILGELPEVALKNCNSPIWPDCQLRTPRSKP